MEAAPFVVGNMICIAFNQSGQTYALSAQSAYRVRGCFETVAAEMNVKYVNLISTRRLVPCG
jgi:hypothetical protein